MIFKNIINKIKALFKIKSKSKKKRKDNYPMW